MKRQRGVRPAVVTAVVTAVLAVATGGCGLAGGGTNGPVAVRDPAATRTPAATHPAATPTSPTASPRAAATTPTAAPARVTPAGSPAAATPPATAAVLAGRAYARMTPHQRVGQLFLAGVDVSGPSRADVAALSGAHAGGVFLAGRSYAGLAAVRALAGRLRSDATQAGVAPYVATDQEGGAVQVLNGPGFADLPSAHTQGGWPASTLRVRAAQWGGQLAAAGVRLNLAPVADVVPAAVGTANAPIGRYYREYGHTPAVVAPAVLAFAAGMRAAGVATAVKHFPGLGRASGNTDTAADVVDPTTRTDPYLAPFAAAVRAGVRMVMVSSARYPAIDRGRIAAFSPAVVGGLLRGRLGFRGVVVSDDLARAAAVRSVPYGERAVRFFAAGGDLLLATDASVVPAMSAAVLARAGRDPAFAATVKAAVLRVLTDKLGGGAGAGR